MQTIESIKAIRTIAEKQLKELDQMIESMSPAIEFTTGSYDKRIKSVYADYYNKTIDITHPLFDMYVAKKFLEGINYTEFIKARKYNERSSLATMKVLHDNCNDETEKKRIVEFAQPAIDNFAKIFKNIYDCKTANDIEDISDEQLETIINQYCNMLSYVEIERTMKTVLIARKYGVTNDAPNSLLKMLVTKLLDEPENKYITAFLE